MYKQNRFMLGLTIQGNTFTIKTEQILNDMVMFKAGKNYIEIVYKFLRASQNNTIAIEFKEVIFISHDQNGDQK